MNVKLLKTALYILSGVFTMLNAYGEDSANVRFIFSQNVLSEGKVELVLSVYSNYINEEIEIYEHRKNIVVTNPLVVLDLPVGKEVSYLTVTLLVNDELHFFDHRNNLFLVENTDSLSWEIDEKVKLTEKGSQKNVLRQRLANYSKPGQTAWLQHYLVQGNTERYFEILNEHYGAVAAQKVAYLDQLMERYHLTEDAYEFIKKECIYEVECMRVTGLTLSMKQLFHRQTNPHLKEELNKLKSRHWNVDSDHPTIIRFFRDLIVLEERLFYGFTSSSKDHFPPDLSVFSELISTIPSKTIRDRLYPVIFLRFNTGSVNGREAIGGAIEKVSDQRLKSYLKNINEIRYSYADVYPFQMEDLEGAIYTPDSFSGKKVIFDFWFTGCVWCSVLHPTMVDFEKELNDPNVLFVTVNVDMNKDKWKEGIDEGIYTETDGINLRLVDRDMLSYYQYNAFPQLMVMDEHGKLLEMNVPLPVNQAKRKLFKSILYSR